ncbi:SLC52A3 family protein [Megaselia abdita]
MKFAKISSAFKERSITVDFLSILFGIAAWIGINSLFIELPLLVEKAPEGWNLPSYLTIMVQLANVGPLFYTLAQKYLKRKLDDAHIIYVVLAIGTVSSILVAFLYDKTAYIGGEEHSVALFVLVFFLAVNCCTSSVLFMPYMGRFKEIYLISYLTGEGLSGLVPSVVALIQGVGGKTECVPLEIENGTSILTPYTSPPLFGSQAFFIFVFVVMFCSSVAFALLDKLDFCKKQYAKGKVDFGNDYSYDQEKEGSETFVQISRKQYAFLLILIGVLSFLANGMFNSILSYSCLPYGSQAYHLSATLSVIANPVACFLAVFLPHTSLKSILTLSGVIAVLTTYCFVTAGMSPNPPLVGTAAGGVLIIIFWTILNGFVSYVKLCITTVMRSQGGKSLVWVGAITQLGATLGAVIIFVLINFAKVFTATEEAAC